MLKKFPTTGYEVSKLANIPQARTYDTLKVLEQKNVVVPSNTKPVSYTPIKPKQLLSSYQKKMNSTLTYLEKHLPEVKENYNELFYPTETQWREKTVEDFKIATEGVLKAKLK